MDFESSKDIEGRRKNIAEARQAALERAQRKYLKQQKRLEKEKRSGQDVWLLPSLSEKVDKEARRIEDARSAGPKVKKAKKEKKKKRSKKKSKDRGKQKDGSPSSDGCSTSEDDWMEKKEEQSKHLKQEEPGGARAAVATPLAARPKRDEWMTLEQELVPCSTRDELREKIRQDKERCRREADEQLGQHVKELNPYWKNGGSGLPPTAANGAASATDSSSALADRHPGRSSAAVAGDGGVAWYRAAYERCIKQAAAENRSLEDVAATRWGSLEKLQMLLMDAERVAELQQQRQRDQQEQQQQQEDRQRRRRRDRLCQDDSNSSNRSSDRCRSDGRERRDDARRRRQSSPSASSSCSSLSPAHPSPPRGRGGSGNASRRRSPEEPRSSRRRHGERSRGSRSPDGGGDSQRDGRSGASAAGPSVARRSAFLRPSADDDATWPARGSGSRGSGSSGSTAAVRNGAERAFRKPGADVDGDAGRTMRSENEAKTIRQCAGREAGGAQAPSWRKQTAAAATAEVARRWSSENAQGSVVESASLRSGNHSSDRQRKPSSRDRKQDPSSSSSSSSSGSSSGGEDAATGSSVPSATHEAEAQGAAAAAEVLTEAQKNELGAAILRAELCGDDELATRLKAQLDSARRQQPRPAAAASMEPAGASGGKSQVIVLSHVDHRGKVRPAALGGTGEGKDKGQRRGGPSQRKVKGHTHDASGQRQRYFQDDDKFDLRALVENERFTSAEDQNSMFRKNINAASQRTDDDFQVDDIFLQKAMYRHTDEKLEQKQREFAQAQSRRLASTLDGCRRCFDTCTKHLVVAIGDKVYLTLPDHEGLCEGHCLIVPMQHTASSTAMDEDVYSEMQAFRRALVSMFRASGEDCVFMECSMGLKRLPHSAIECVPLPTELGDLAPIYFKKAIMESESEWAQNKKLVDLRKSDIRRSVPKGFPYFAVDFGLQSGFAHVIENESAFPAYFGKEVVGGMLDAEPRLWRKPAREEFEVQRLKVLAFAERWKPFDATVTAHAEGGSSSG